MKSSGTLVSAASWYGQRLCCCSPRARPLSISTERTPLSPLCEDMRGHRATCINGDVIDGELPAPEVMPAASRLRRRRHDIRTPHHALLAGPLATAVLRPSLAGCSLGLSFVALRCLARGRLHWIEGGGSSFPQGDPGGDNLGSTRWGKVHLAL
jgi:hypothetical protein